VWCGVEWGPLGRPLPPAATVLSMVLAQCLLLYHMLRTSAPKKEE